ncbi:hypothetical protein HYW60_02805 [Candidatus Kaiserbacteria bacterium]|nr:hypothetical protein [Candidatus Kaiserbacteria bacterium]
MKKRRDYADISPVKDYEALKKFSEALKVEHTPGYVIAVVIVAAGLIVVLGACAERASGIVAAALGG